MAISQNTVIILKYSDVTTVPPSLNIAEPAYSNVSNKLFINDGNNVVAIGGKYYTDDLESATWQGIANTLIRRDAAGQIEATKYYQEGFDLLEHSNAAFNLANTVSGEGISTVFNQANSAFDTANSSYIKANAAFNKANTAAGANGAIQFNLLGGYGAHNEFYYNSGLKTVYANTFYASSNVDAQNVIAYNRFYAGIATQKATPVPYLLAQFTGNTSPYVQVNLQNIDGEGSADMVVTSDVGDDSTFYITTGIQGSQLEQGALYPLDGYVIVQGNTSQLGGNLVIGAISGTPGIKTKIVSHGFETDNVVAEFDETGIIFYPELTSPTTTRLTLATASAYDSQNSTGRYANSAYLHANAAFESANNVAPQVQPAFNHANAAYQSQNTTGVYANAAFSAQNTTGIYANSAFDMANTAYQSGGVTAGGYANSAYLHANAAYQSQNTTGSYANSSYTHANAAYVSANTTGVYVNAAFDFANTSNVYFYGVNESQNTEITAVASHANSAYQSQNTTGVYANTVYLHSNAAYQSQNTTGVYANSAYIHANSSYIAQNTTGVYANSSYIHANAAYESQNTTGVYANSAYIHANAAYISQNTTGSYANSAYLHANASYVSQNTTGSYANSSYTHSNAAFNFANTKFASAGGTITGDVILNANLTVSGITTYVNTQTVLIGDNILTLNADIPQDQTPSEDAGIEIDRGSSANTLLIWNETTDKWTFTNNGTDYHNIGSDAAESYANSAYLQANSSYVSQNTTGVYANSAFLHANAAFESANNVAPQVQPAFDKANAAYQSQNTTGVYANTAYLHVNAAYSFANTVNAYFYGVDAEQNTSITTIGADANSAYQSQNTTGIYANAAFTAANVADQRAVTSGSYANSAYLHANSSYVSQNTTGSYANSSYLHANSAFESQNTSGTYANSAYLQANAAFIKANTAAGSDGQIQLNTSGGFGASGNLKFSNVTNTLITNNITVIANVGYANSTGSLKVYQFFNEATNSLDTVFL